MDSGSAQRFERQDLAVFDPSAKSRSYSAAARNDIAVGDSLKLLCFVSCKGIPFITMLTGRSLGTNGSVINSLKNALILYWTLDVRR